MTVFLWAGVAAAAVLDVGVGRPYPTAAAAVAVAADGDEIRLHDAWLTEDLIVDGRSLTFTTTSATEWVPASVTPLWLTNGATVTVEGVTFGGFTSAKVVSESSTLTLSGCAFTGAGEVHVSGGTAEIVDGTFHDLLGGAGVWVTGGATVTVRDSVFVDNGFDEVALHVDAGLLRVRGSVLARNFSGGSSGAAVRCHDRCELRDNLIRDNEGFLGAAVFSTVDLELVGNRICRNDSTQGAVLVYGAASIRNNAFVENAALADGPALTTSFAEVELLQNSFVGNSTPTGGSALLAHESDATLDGNVFDHNLGTTHAGLALGGTIAADYGAWFANVGGDASWTLGPNDLVGVNPRLRNTGGACSWDRIRPRASSPLIDAGNPAITDPDGSRADLGATGGPDAR